MMFLKGSLAAVATILFFLTHAQNVIILDQKSGSPISDVYLYHSSGKKTAFSDLEGKADLSQFPKKGRLIFQHPAYKQYSLDVARLSDPVNEIFLEVKIIEFDEIVIAANKWEQNRDEIPNAITSISPDDIAFNNPQTSADLLSNTGQVFVQKSQHGGGSPKLRGFSANAVLLVVDGIRMNNAIYRSGNLQNVINIDANAIERAEVLFGPGSVMYGSDAMGGVMDFHTLNPEWNKVTSSALVRVNSSSKERTVHADLSYGKEKIAWVGSISYSDFGDLISGSIRKNGYQGHFKRKFIADRKNGVDVLKRNNNENAQLYSGFSILNTLNKVRIKTSPTSLLTYGHYFSTTSDIPRYDRLTTPIEGTDSLENAEWYYGPQTWQMHALTLDVFNKTSIYDQMRATFSYQKYEESRYDRKFGDEDLRIRSEEVDIYTFNLDFDLEFTSAKLFYGFDFFINQIESTGRKKNILTGNISPTSPRYPDDGSVYSSVAAYINYQRNLTERIILTGGSRFNFVSLQAKTNDPVAQSLFFNKADLNNQAINGSLGLVYNKNPKSKFSLLASTGFRAPNVDDVGKLFELDDDVILVPNNDLKPEYSFNQEMSYTYSNKGLKAEAVIYHSYLFNAIVRGEYELPNQTAFTNTEVRAQVNANRARIYGGSFSLKYAPIKSVKMASIININEGKDLTNNEPLRHSTPIFGQTSVKYAIKSLKTELEANYHFKKGVGAIPSTEIIDKAYLYTDEGTPGWCIISSRFSYELPPRLTLNAGIENIFDIHYRPYSSGISASGRNFYIGLRFDYDNSRG